MEQDAAKQDKPKRGEAKREKLTPAFINKAPPPSTGDRAIYWDSNQPGFGLLRHGPRPSKLCLPVPQCGR